MLEARGEHIFTVTEITRDIRVILEETFQGVWVEGEISNFKASVSGHAYFSLKDENSLLKSVIFKGNAMKLRFTPEDGMHVLCFGRVSVYDKSGQHQLYVETIEPRGKGALYAAFEQLKEKLNKEGLFDEARKRPLPLLPKHIGVVTSATGAVVKDIVKVARRRYPNIAITILPVKVQGDEAKKEISEAINIFNEYNDSLPLAGTGDDPIDVMIVGRGGGSLEDLWAFNEEVVARAIFASKIPIVSAVGHEVDYTIADLASDKRAATPSQAAEIVVPDRKELEQRINMLRGRLDAAVSGEIDVLREKLDGLKNAYVLREPINFILQREQELDETTRRMNKGVEIALDNAGHRMKGLVGKFEAMSPLAVMQRGYSVTFKNGKVLKTAKDIKKGDMITTRLAAEEIVSSVEKISSIPAVKEA